MVLHEVYMDQNKEMGKEGKVFFKDSFQLDTFITGGDNWTNFVDEGPGSELHQNSDLAINEFDPSLRAVMSFGDPEAFKALVCPLGLEEMRLVVYYELINLYQLITAVRHNQVLLDTLQRQLAEIDLFEKGVMVTAPAWDMASKLTGQNLHESNLKKLPPSERQLLK